MYPQTHMHPPAAFPYEPPHRRETSVRSKRQKLIAAGKCVNYSRCGNERGEKGTATMCRPCAAEKSAKQAPKLARSRRRKARRGLCIESRCDDPVRRDKKRCMHHLIAAAQAAKRHRDKLKEAGDE